ncbi:MAG: hypothetical protein DRI90_24165, partial [Deltaproteobacteria bacterium]
MQSLARPLTIGDYEIVRRIDSVDLDLSVARKAGPDNEAQLVLAAFDVADDQVEVLTDGVARCQKLKHPAVVQVVDHFAHEEQQVLVFDALEGVSLLRIQRLLEKRGEQLSDRAIVHLGKELAGALDEAHSGAGVADVTPPTIHGQLGPHQVFVTWDGDVRIFGLGLSALFPPPVGESSPPSRVDAFMAPEVRDGVPLTPRANAYSVAAVLWSLLSGKLPPADGTAPRRLRAVRPDLPLLLCSGLGRALEVVPRRRVNCRALVRTLARVVKPADRSELEWTMESLRPLVTDPDLLLVEAFPPRNASLTPYRSSSQSSQPVSNEGSVSPSSSPPAWTEPPDSEEEPTSPYFRVPAHLAHIKLPDSVVPPEEDDAPADADAAADDGAPSTNKLDPTGDGDDVQAPGTTERAADSGPVSALSADVIEVDGDRARQPSRARASGKTSAVFKSLRRGSKPDLPKANQESDAKPGPGRLRKPRPRIKKPARGLTGPKAQNTTDSKATADKPEVPDSPSGRDDLAAPDEVERLSPRPPK